ncbi:HNH endonuclease [Bacillus cereus]|nr:HNH endonuclease [Bacillus cereus]
MIEFQKGYFVDDLGRIFSNKRVEMRQLSVKPNSKGYACVRLCENGKRKRKSVHRIYALAYLPNPENKPFINHIDANRMNYELSNLEWCTQSENMKHTYVIGRENPKVKSNVLEEIRRLKELGYGCRRVAKVLGISKSTANNYMREMI